MTVLIGSADEVAVRLTQVESFSVGFRFTLAVRVRQLRPQLARGELFLLIGSHVRPGVEISLEDRLLLGIEYPDGRRASTRGEMRMQGPGTVTHTEQLVLVRQGGGGHERTVDQIFWVAPLPLEGPLAFVVTWPGFGIEETRRILDGAAIRAAASRSQTLWPPQAVAEPPPQPPPPRRSSGWFTEPPRGPE